MQVIPAINAQDFETVKKQSRIAAGLSDWVHIDIVDGKFASNVTWNEPEKLPELRKANYEIHLMVVNPKEVVEKWLKNGAKRIIIHLEILKSRAEADSILEVCKKYNAQTMLAISPNGSLDDLLVYLDKFSYFQILAVPPGIAGQLFDWENISRVKFLRKQSPSAIIEVDGGINPKMAKLVKNAGADIIVSASYIFNSPDPIKAYEELKNL